MCYWPCFKGHQIWRNAGWSFILIAVVGSAVFVVIRRNIKLTSTPTFVISVIIIIMSDNIKSITCPTQSLTGTGRGDLSTDDGNFVSIIPWCTCTCGVFAM